MTKWIVLLIAWINLPLCGLQEFSQGTSNPTSRAATQAIALPELDLQEPITSILSSVLTSSGSSGGIVVTDDDCSPLPSMRFSIADGTKLDSALDEIAARNGRSTWHVADGVVNILPYTSVPGILETTIGSFRWDRTASARESIAKLLGTPEVSARAKQIGLQQGPFEGASGALCIRGDCSAKPAPLFETDENVTFLTVLNRIVKAHKGTVWVYWEFHCGGKVRFRVEAIGD